ncbi:MAG: DUF21 domain-containing protein, partial [Bdellovibrionales bacterium]|nr:DUF21 domain-containing protein [Bdellovibrionales bacterium]
FLAVIISFTCSLLESVILSVTPAYIEVQLQKGKKSGKLLKKLKSKIDRPLAAILTLNTIANMVGATGVGAQTYLIYGDAYVGIASAILTGVILIFCEILPKTVGATKWKRLAPGCAYIINGLIYVAYPLVILSELIYDILGNKQSLKVSREEMIVTAELGVSDGTIKQKESAIIRNLLLLDQIRVSDIMTPRSVVMAWDEDQTIEDTIHQFKNIRFSRIPLYKNKFDNITGVIHRHKLLEAASNDRENITLGKIKSDIFRVHEDIPVSSALDQFLKQKVHLFLAIDPVGTPTGIVTLEDAIETLLGVEIMDEFDNIEDMRNYALELWRSKHAKNWKR